MGTRHRTRSAGGAPAAPSVLTITVTVLALLAPALNAQSAERAKRLQIPARSQDSALGNPNREIEVFVRLDEPAVAELNAQAMEQSGSFAASDQQKAQAARVMAQQAAFKPSLQSLGGRILASQRVGANGMRVMVRPSDVAQLKQLPGVRSVGRVTIHRPDNIDSVPWIGAPAVWSSVGKGEGVKIGIIDTGIDYTHATFGGSGNPADYTSNDPLVVEPGTFPVPGGAVRGGIDLAGATYNADIAGSVPAPDADPIDGSGHGTHVAATAAGRGVPGVVGAGVAPGAQLYAIKVFGDNGGSTDLTSTGIEWAMDPNGDGDMSDHLDVINMSLGSPFGNPNDPAAISSENAAKLGIIVVASAGNEGTAPYVTGAPAVAPAAISVAATMPGGRLYARFTVTAPAAVAGTYPSVEGLGPVTLKAVGSVSGNLAATTPANGCTPLTNNLGGQIALIIRGTCNFVVKYQNAQAAGATAIVVYNDGADATRQDPIAMGSVDGTTIPGLMVSYSTGTKLKGLVGVQVTLDAARDTTKEDAITSFSSIGPSRGDSAFKPDLSAPGDSIVSAGVGTGTGAATLSGTSMAAPHVTGAAALLRQQHPKLDQSAIKALLQNSTVNANSSVDARLTRQGTGVLRVDNAARLTSYASPGGISFGRLNPLLPIVRTEKIQVTNLSDRPRTFGVKHVPNRAVPGVTVQCPNSVSVGGSRTAKTEILLKFDPISSAKQNVSDDGSVSQREVDGWCVLSDGKDQLRVGYIAVVDPASSVIVTTGPTPRKVTVHNLGPAVGIAEGFTLAKLGGQNTDDTESSIAAVGFRRADPSLYDNLPVIEIGVVTEAPFSTLSSLKLSMLIDTNKDGQPEVEIQGLDLATIPDSGVDPGTYVTRQTNSPGTTDANKFFLDWIARSWDFNDRTFVLPFTLQAGSGLVPEKFDYTLRLTSNDGSEDVQQGSIDLSKEIVPDLNSFSIEGGETVQVQMSGGKGLSLWLLPNNPLFGQMGVTATP